MNVGYVVNSEFSVVPNAEPQYAPCYISVMRFVELPHLFTANPFKVFLNLLAVHNEYIYLGL
jgi:hypothetical protein